MPAAATVCPACGTPTVFAPGREASTSYGQFVPDDYGDTPSTPVYEQYEQGYRPPFEAPPRQSTNYVPPPYHPHNPYAPPNPPPIYNPPINVTVVNNFVTPSLNKNNALLTEVLCSLFGVYGIGWLMAGETVTGVILLVCSFLVIWPLAITIAVITLGFGIFFCNLPLAVIGIIVNAIFLNNALNRKVIPMTYMAQAQPMQQQMPPRRMPQ
jgi:TM2 domain-containing membrane protein YozV